TRRIGNSRRIASIDAPRESTGPCRSTFPDAELTSEIAMGEAVLLVSDRVARAPAEWERQRRRDQVADRPRLHFAQHVPRERFGKEGARRLQIEPARAQVVDRVRIELT